MATESDRSAALSLLAKYAEYEEKLEAMFRVDIFPPLKYNVKENQMESAGKKRKASKRVLALSTLRLMLIKKTTLPLHSRKVMKNIHLYDLHEITSKDETSAILSFRGVNMNKSIEVKSGQIADVIMAIRILYNQISVGYPPRATMQISVPPAILKYVPETDPNSMPAGGLLHLYKAQCAYFRDRVSAQLMNHVEDQIAFDALWQQQGGTSEWLHTDQNPLNLAPKTLELHRIPGILRSSTISFSLPPIAAALRHNTYFQTLRLCDVSDLKQIILLLANIVRHNKTVSRLEMENLSASQYFLSFGDMLRDNRDHAIQYLSLQGSKITTEGMLALAIALERFQHVLKGLNLSSCAINGKRLDILMNAFRRHYAMSIAIEELNLSNNKFDTESSKAFEKWLFEAKEFSHLRKLKLACSNVNMVVVSRSFRSLRYLQSLNLSGNKLDANAVELLRVAIEESTTLQRLNVSSCSLKPALIQKLISSMMENRSLKNTHIEISYNKCKSKQAACIAEAFKRGQNLHTLKFRGYKWKPEALILLLRSLARKKFLDTLILDQSCRVASTGSKELARALTLTLKHTPSLRALSLNGGFNLVVPPFLEKLGKNQSLLELSIEQNRLKDFGAYEIAEMLRFNRTLMLLKCDRNSIGVNGWKSLKLAFEMNHSLMHLPYPWIDLHALSSSMSRSQEEVLRQLLLDIQGHTSTNTPSCPTREYVFVDEKKLNVPPQGVDALPTLPEHLAYLQKEAQIQFKEKKPYWMVNDPDELPEIGTPTRDEDIEFHDALDDTPPPIPAWDSEWDSSGSSSSCSSIDSPPCSPMIPQRPMPSPLRSSGLAVPNRPMPSPGAPSASTLAKLMLDEN